MKVVGGSCAVELEDTETLKRARCDEDDLALAGLEGESALWVDEEPGAGGLAVVVAVEDDGIPLMDGDFILGFGNRAATPGGRLAPGTPACTVRRDLDSTYASAK